MEALTGDALKAKFAELRAQDATEDQAAIACGYVNAEGKPQVRRFKDALQEAHGLALPKAKRAGGGKGKPLSFNVTVGKTGSIMLAAGYGAKLGLKPGDVVSIAHQGDSLQLKAAAAATAGHVAPF
jgi:hypothetical protein